MDKLKALCSGGLEFLLDLIKGSFVEKEEGKGLSEQNFTQQEKTKLSGLKNPTIESVKVNNQTLIPDSAKSVNIDLSNYATKEDISSVYKYQGTVSTYAQLPTNGVKPGDVYNVETADKTHGIKAGDNVAWNGTAWDVLAGTIDTSNFVQNEQLNSYVLKEEGKGLSEVNFTKALKDKYDSLKNYVHPTSDGNKHVPANGTTNAGKVLTATAQAGVYEWQDPVNVEEITEAEIQAMWNKV